LLLLLVTMVTDAVVDSSVDRWWLGRSRRTLFWSTGLDNRRQLSIGRFVGLSDPEEQNQSTMDKFHSQQ